MRNRRSFLQFLFSFFGKHPHTTHCVSSPLLLLLLGMQVARTCILTFQGAGCTVYAFLCFVASLSIVVNKVYEAHERRKLGMTSYMLASPNEVGLAPAANL